VVFKLSPSGTETVVYRFSGQDGANPHAGLVRDGAGNLYGTTSGGGAGVGVVFKLSPSGTETVLHSFTGDDGINPLDLVRDAAGNLYGTTASGGSWNIGVVFELVRSDSTYQSKVLFTFTGNMKQDGAYPLAGLVRDVAGNLYGTTSYGGTHGWGVVFKLSPTGSETVLHSFTNGADGAYPAAGLIQDAAGNLYGTTYGAGAHGFGVVFELIRCDSEPSGYEFRPLYSFTGGAAGAYPLAGLVRDMAGNLYGTTSYGGTHGWGVVFKLSPTGSETVLHSFTNGADGAYPAAGLIQDAAGNLYGTTTQGGATSTCEPPYGCGVVFKLTP
jgi:uncharacterized repeat protein (TIGR03803 family)